MILCVGGKYDEDDEAVVMLVVSYKEDWKTDDGEDGEDPPDERAALRMLPDCACGISPRPMAVSVDKFDPAGRWC